ncbi:acyl-CoA dehydrogenase family protein [Pseudorhodoferax sp. Leaf267]|uniref:acyl-CoA dehydrogenase family protein n=1 Tax=Pseudorhodoferax sp. Leaf267 TaxID=1736316 RepID=UPI0006FF1D1B|nr:acyl-CoA dehydrogenase family protein [Pseudorhodoferax sp. Leaf267]KQP23501.1 acyl-CoA dehydrogenase [Pseudorhodoferax sp. Leaf267]
MLAPAANPLPPSPGRDTAQALQALIASGDDDIPLPGSGRTLQRWQALADVAQRDLSLIKLFEGHTDALAIQAELGVHAAQGIWGTWCAEPPDARLQCSAPDAQGRIRLDGRKAWCSGAQHVSHAIVSGWNPAGEPCLAAVAMDQPGVRVTGEGWNAVGMAGTASVDVWFDGAQALAVGAPHAYVQRPGFWHGGAGIAACWWGGAVGIGRVVLAQAARRHASPDPHQSAHLGQIDIALRSSAALLREAAAWIDAHPQANAQALALRVRLAVERDAGQVLWHAGRAVGAGPLCKNAGFARAMADLPVFMRQSHAEKDLAALGQQIDEEHDAWTL